MVAPSSPFDRTLVRAGMAWLGRRYRVRFDPSLFSRTGFLAGDDARRLSELNAALADSETQAIIAARGGYGLGRIAPSLELGPLVEHPKWIVGFSDLTALHLEAARVGVMSLHAHNVAGLGPGDGPARDAWVSALERPAARTFERLEVLHAGEAEGPLAGGNLKVLFMAHAAGRLRLPRGAILLLEDVSETSYRIDRMLTALLQAGALAQVSGLALGEFTDCSPGRYSVPTREVLSERLGLLGVPVLAGLPVGHGRHNAPLVLGAPARLSTRAGTLTVDAAREH
ncbi:MAG TPA: LD-carboxypeptidase [Polyangiaceae bacterium]|nr:LD-carboxypeptidase [Polyangiaceae bacterium]